LSQVLVTAFFVFFQICETILENTMKIDDLMLEFCLSVLSLMKGFGGSMNLKINKLTIRMFVRINALFKLF
jgi:hypothetical protein